MAEAGLNTRAEVLSPAEGGEVAEYFALMKPRVMFLVVFTALVGLVAAPGHMHPVLAVAALLCIAGGAGAAGALNMWYDADIDARMARTSARPIPRGKITADEARAFGTVLAIGSVATLGVIVNWVAGALLAFTIAFYILVYTMWLKRRTPQNIVIGGAAGAVPPLVGWAAGTGHVGVAAWLLFAIVFVWTPPHFWALALLIKDSYANARVPMLPVVRGERETARQIVLYSVLLVAVTLTPWAWGSAGLAYVAAALALGSVFVWLAERLRRDTTPRRAMLLFHYSLLYLALLFAALALDVSL
jgi:protoheme IX farnesyltransferase